MAVKTRTTSRNAPALDVEMINTVDGCAFASGRKKRKECIIALLSTIIERLISNNYVAVTDRKRNPAL